jgi:hypothetical protein
VSKDYLSMNTNEPKECPKYHLGESHIPAKLFQGGQHYANVLVLFAEKKGLHHSCRPTDEVPLDKVPKLPVTLTRLDTGVSMNLQHISLCYDNT